MARGDAEDFVTEQSGIFEIAASLPSRDEDRDWAAIIGFVLMWMLFGTATVIAYVHTAML